MKGICEYLRMLKEKRHFGSVNFHCAGGENIILTLKNGEVVKAKHEREVIDYRSLLADKKVKRIDTVETIMLVKE